MTNGYVQITIDGVAVGLKFAYPAIKWFIEESVKPENKDMFFIQSDEGGLTVEGLACLIEGGYRNNCWLKKVEPVLTYEKFFDYVEVAQEDETGIVELTKVMETYAATSTVKKLIESQKKSQITSL